MSNFKLQILTLFLLVSPAIARNVDLSTVPKRNTVALTIYNSEDLTLVRETRVVTFKKGVNPLQFSWANTLIDPTSVELKFATNPDKLDAAKKEALASGAGRSLMKVAAGAATASPATQPPEEKQIIKEGLSEYFVFSIEGTETIQNGWSKRMRSIDAATVPVKIQYRFRPQEYGEQLVRMYLMSNDKPSKLGVTPLPDGIVRVFRDNGRGGLSYLTQQSIKYIPIGDKIELNLGPDPEVIFELIKPRTTRDNLWVQLNGTNQYRQVGASAVVRAANTSVAGWDDHALF